MSGENGTSEGAANATGENAGSDSSATNTQTTQQGEQGTQTGSDGGENTGTTTSETKTYSVEEFEALKARMIAADKRADAEAAKVKKFENANKSDLERAQQEAADAKTRADQLAATVKNQALLNAFLGNTSITWQDPTDAFALLQQHYMDGVEVDEAGKVTGMDGAVKTLAKNKAYLIKPATSSEATGTAQNGQRKGEKDGGVDAGLKSRFPTVFNR